MSRALRDTVRALPTLLRVGFAAAVAYRSEFVIWVLTTNMPLVMMALWTAVAREGPVGRFSERDFVAYFLAMLVVRQLTSAWVVWEMNQEVRDGTLAARLLRPVHPYLLYATDNLAGIPLRMVVSFPVAVALVQLTGDRLNRDPLAWLVVPLAIAGGWLLNFATMLAIGALSFFLESSLAVYEAWLAVSFVFSGYILPLALLPRPLRVLAAWLPFRYTLSFPVEAMLGLASRAELLTALAVQWGYAALSVALAWWTFRRGVVRFAAFGG